MSTVLDSVFDVDPGGDFVTFTGACHLRTLRPLMGHPRWEEVDPVLRHFVERGQSTTAEELLQIHDRFHLMNLRLVELFHTARILVTPTCSAVAPFAGEMTSSVNGETTVNWVQFTYPFNMTRSPAATVCGRPEQRRPAHRPAARRPPARRPGRAAHGRRARGGGGSRYARHAAHLRSPPDSSP